MSSLEFLLDENMPIEVKEFLKSRALSVEYAPRGVANSEVADLAKSKGSVLLTRDSHFLNTDLFPSKEFCGIVVFVIHPPEPERLVEATDRVLSEVRDFTGKTYVVGEGWFKLVEE